jgi:hypothetical protein
VNRSVKDLEKAGNRVDDVTGKNDGRYRAAVHQLQLGDSRARVIELLGEPRDRQVTHSEFGENEWLYYGSWQILLSDGVVTAKSRF